MRTQLGICDRVRPPPDIEDELLEVRRLEGRQSLAKCAASAVGTDAGYAQDSRQGCGGGNWLPDLRDDR